MTLEIGGLCLKISFKSGKGRCVSPLWNFQHLTRVEVFLRSKVLVKILTHPDALRFFLGKVVLRVPCKVTTKVLMGLKKNAQLASATISLGKH